MGSLRYRIQGETGLRQSLPHERLNPHPHIEPRVFSAAYYRSATNASTKPLFVSTTIDFGTHANKSPHPKEKKRRECKLHKSYSCANSVTCWMLNTEFWKSEQGEEKPRATKVKPKNSGAHKQEQTPCNEDSELQKE